MKPNEVARTWMVSGRVQGVGYRAFVVDRAIKLNLAGWARNLDDGRVEVHAVGPVEALNDLSAALRLGPRFAEVRHVEEAEDTARASAGFLIR